MTDPIPNPNGNQIFLNGGLALVNGKFIQMNNQVVIIPFIQELYFDILSNINWILCVNDKGEYQPIPLLDYDAALSTPNNPNRLFNAYNVSDASTYYLDATTFSDLVNKRKDLTPLYIVSSIISDDEITLNLTDVRKYVNDGDSNLPLRLTSAEAQGNFKSPVAIFNWIKYNNIFNGIAFVKGANTENGTIETDVVLDFTSKVIIDGENNAALIMNGLITIGSNLTLQNMQIDFNGGVAVQDSAHDIVFKNCDITISVTSPAPDSNVIFNIASGSNIIIEDCAIVVNYSDLFVNATERGSVFRLFNTDNFQFINSSLETNYVIESDTGTPGDVFSFNLSSNLVIKDSEFTGNFNKFINITDSNDLKIGHCTVTSTYNPKVGSTGDIYNSVAYNEDNFVNVGQGYIYSNVTSTISNIEVDDVTFNYQPGTAAASYNRYSFINFQLPNITSILSNVSINNCKFINLNTSGLYDDVRPAVAIINTCLSSIATSQQPIISNIKITNNYCNKNQSIIVTSQLRSPPNIFKWRYPGLAANNCVIRDNICGTIGYWISSGSKTESYTHSIFADVNSLTDNIPGLLIDNNTCHYIANMEATGHYFGLNEVVLAPPFTGTTNKCDYPSGDVCIKNNKCSWIHVGISFEESSSLAILNNSLTAYSETYTSQFDDDSSSTINRGYGYAILVTSNKHTDSNTNSLALGEGEGNDSSCIIQGNTTSTGYWLQTNLLTSTFKYSAGYVYCQSSNIIKNNIFKGINETALSAAATPAILVSGLTNNISGNKIYRHGKGISAYVKFAATETPTWDGSGSTGIIVDNFYDSPFINDSSLSENVISIATAAIDNWIFERNKNQTGTAVIPVTNKPFFNGVFPKWGPDNTSATDLKLIGVMNDGASLALGPGSTSTGSYRSQSTIITDSSFDDGPLPANRLWGFQENVEKFLPNGVRLLTIKQGFRPWESVIHYYTDPDDIPDGYTNGNFFLNISSLDESLVDDDLTDTDYFTSISSDDLAIYERTSPVYDVITGGQVNATSFNLPFFINLEDYDGDDVSFRYVTGRGRGITVSGDWRWRRFNYFGTIHFTLSPIVIKYRW